MLMTAEEALKKLKQGNERYVEGFSDHPHENIEYRKSLTTGQHPFAVVLTCADSRVTPEIVFDQGLGDLFVIRIAGNISESQVIGSIEYAAKYLGSKLVVVMGHESCGAVGAALGSKDPGGQIGKIIEKIKPAVYASKGQEGDLLANSVKLNAKITAEELKESKPILNYLVDNSGLVILPAYYKLTTGEVEFI